MIDDNPVWFPHEPRINLRHMDQELTYHGCHLGTNRDQLLNVYGFPWIPMDFYGILMDSYESLWAYGLWTPMDSYGFLWIPMDSYGFSLLTHMEPI
jgi:hypothetical protein